jgi:hypothetical protein
VRVLRPDGGHSWPLGWAVAKRPDGTGLLQRELEPPAPGTAGGTPAPDAGSGDAGVPEAGAVG